MSLVQQILNVNNNNLAKSLVLMVNYYYRYLPIAVLGGCPFAIPNG
ncbi:Uncharacterised protein [Candidatus Venteria ishoeyi]|uniref:Uncharacterized protein n=1 Tax=Candidatus Venteria ishoeyi TaxID=1899563 RepID=A0A1H6F4P8_9GAMM|nr:Uncharacterised protein [Candidatus Venteria ishoeyi]